MREARDSKVPFFEETIRYALHPYRQFHVQSVEYGSHINGESYPVEAIFRILDRLSSVSAANDHLRGRLNVVSSIDEETAEVVQRIVRKDLRCGVAVKTALKVFNGIPIHEVMLCKDDLDAFEKEIGYDWSNACWSVKKDGVRVWVYVYEDGLIWLSRNGKEYHNFHDMDDEVRALSNFMPPPRERECIIFDGEVTAKKGDFQDGMTQVRRKKGETEFFQFEIFDVVSWGPPLEERYEWLEHAFTQMMDPQSVKLIEHVTVGNRNRVPQLLDMMIGIGEEGLVLKDWGGVYEKTRSNSWCKVKKFYTIDMTVKEVLKGTGKYSEMVGAFVCTSPETPTVGKYTYTGTPVKVGSGMTDKQREEFLHNPPEVIEVKFQAVTKDGSLRFPTFVRKRTDKDPE